MCMGFASTFGIPVPPTSTEKKRSESLRTVQLNWSTAPRATWHHGYTIFAVRLQHGRSAMQEADVSVDGGELMMWLKQAPIV